MNTSNIDTLAMAANEERTKMMHAEEESKRNSTENGSAAADTVVGNNNSIPVYDHTVTGSPTPTATSAASHADTASTELSQTASFSPSSKSKPSPTFPDRLHAILSNDSLKNIIAWLPSGKSFCIMNKDDFTERILPAYFKETKYASFQRRLKRWGFRKTYTTGQKQVILFHELFQRDQPHLSKMMTAGQGSSSGATQQQQLIRGSVHDACADSPARQNTVPQEQFQLQMRPRSITHHERASLNVPPPVYAPPIPTFATIHAQHGNGNIMRNNNNLYPPQANDNLYRPHPINPRPSHHPPMPAADPMALHALTAVEEEIRDCQEQLAILHRLRALRERRRAL